MKKKTSKSEEIDEIELDHGSSRGSMEMNSRFWKDVGLGEIECTLS